MTSESTPVAVLFVDICGSTRLYESEGDSAAYDLNERSLQLMTELTEKHGGSVIRVLGDGQLCSFPDADPSFLAALGMQEAHAELPIGIHVAIHFGEVRTGINDDIYGDAVNVTAHVLSRAREGETLLTQHAVHRLSRPLLLGVEELDTTTVKGRREPIKIYRARQDQDAEATTLVTVKVTPPEETPVEVLLIRTGSRKYKLGRGQGTLVMGREPGCDLVIPQPQASRRHASITLERDRHVLTDHSTNGTYFTDDSETVYCLKRESANLGTRGSIGLGVAPQESPDTAIHYQRADLG